MTSAERREQRERLKLLTEAWALKDSGYLDGDGQAIADWADKWVPKFDSSVLEKSVEERKLQEDDQLPFAPIGAALEDAPPDPAWLWQGYLAPGAVTLLAGRPKVGKSTLLFALLTALRAGEPFLGLPTRASKVLLLSEERPGTLEEKRRA